MAQSVLSEGPTLIRLDHLPPEVALLLAHGLPDGVSIDMGGYVTDAELSTALAGRVTDADLQAVRDSVAGKAAASDVASLVNTVAGKYTKPSGGIPAADVDTVSLAGSGAFTGAFAPKFPFALVRPSGDATGAMDIANINAALAAGDVVLMGDFTTNAAVVHPSNRTLTLWNASIYLAPGSNCNVWINANQNATGDDNIVVQGIGRARIYGQVGSLLAANAAVGATSLSLSTKIPTGLYYLGSSYDTDVEQVQVTAITGTSAPFTATLAAPTTIAHTTSAVSWCASQKRDQTQRYKLCGIQPVNVRGLTFQNVGIGPFNFLNLNPQACTDVLIDNITITTDSVTPNQDGVDLFGCQRVLVRGVRGKTGDDFSYCMSQISTPAIHPYLRSVATMPDTYDITYSDCIVDPAANMFRINSGDGKQTHRVRINNCHALKSGNRARINEQGSFLRIGGGIGANGSVVSYPGPTDTSDILVTNVSTRKLRLFTASYSCSDVTIEGVSMDEWTMSVCRVEQAMTAQGITIAGLSATDDTTTAGTVEQAVAVSSGSALTDVTLRNWHLHQCAGLVASDVIGTVTNATIDDIRIDTATAALFTISPVSGRIDGVSTKTFSGARFAAQLALRWGVDMPVVRATDTVPKPLAGSQITCGAGLDPTGGAATAGGQYIGDGTAWNRIVALANDPAGVAVSDTTKPVISAFTATAGNSQAVLGWTASDNVAVTRAVVTRAGTTVYDGTGSSVTDTGLTNGTTYSYSLTVYDAAGNFATATATATPAAPGAGETAVFSDPFTRADQTGGLGNGWAIMAGAVDTGAIISGAATSKYGTASATKYFRAPTNPTSPNQYVQCAVTAAPGGSQAYPTMLARATDSGTAVTGYMARYDASAGGFVVLKVVGGTATALATIPTATPAVPFTQRLDASTSTDGATVTLTVKLAGSVIGTATDATSPITAVGSTGLVFRSTSTSISDSQRADDFVNGNLAT